MSLYKKIEKIILTEKNKKTSLIPITEDNELIFIYLRSFNSCMMDYLSNSEELNITTFMTENPIVSEWLNELTIENSTELSITGSTIKTTNEMTKDQLFTYVFYRSKLNNNYLHSGISPLVMLMIQAEKQLTRYRNYNIYTIINGIDSICLEELYNSIDINKILEHFKLDKLKYLTENNNTVKNSRLGYTITIDDNGTCTYKNSAVSHTNSCIKKGDVAICH